MRDERADRTPAKLMFVGFIVLVATAVTLVKLNQRSLAARRIDDLGNSPVLVEGKITDLHGPSYMDNPPRMKYSFAYRGSERSFSHSRKVPCGSDLPRDSALTRRIYVAVDAADPSNNWPLLTKSDYDLLKVTPRDGYYFDDEHVCF